MPTHWLVLIIVVVAALGWLAGVLTFKRSLTWCPRDGATLTCPVCDRRPMGIGLVTVRGIERSIAPLAPEPVLTMSGRPE